MARLKSRTTSPSGPGAADQRDQLDVGPERLPPDLCPEDPAYLRLVGPNQWPAGVPTVKPAVLAERWSGDVLAARPS